MFHDVKYTLDKAEDQAVSEKTAKYRQSFISQSPLDKTLQTEP